MLHRLICTLTVIFAVALTASPSISHASRKLDPGYHIPDHVKFILHLYDAIEREDTSLINPEAFHRRDLHKALTLFFDPHWEEKGKDIPTNLMELETHYNVLRKICTADFTKILTPYWAHGKSLELLESFKWEGTYPSAWEVNIQHKPLIMTDPITHEGFQHDSLLKILLRLSSIQKSKTPYMLVTRGNLPPPIALPTEIENPVFLMALADNMEDLVSIIFSRMRAYNDGEIAADQFAHALKSRLLPDNDLESTFEFEYITWYIQNYDVFGEN